MSELGGFEPGHEPILPEETLALAVAIADRAARMSEVHRSITSQIYDVPSIEKTPEQLRAEHLGRTTLLLLQVEDPSRLLTMADILETTNLGDAGYESRAQLLNERLRGASVSADDVRSLYDTMSRDLQARSGMTDERLTEDFAKQLTASKEVAVEYGVDVATVYENDDLYYEAARRADPPEVAAAEMKAMIDALSADLMNKLMMQMYEPMLPAGVREMLSDDELTEMIMDAQLDPESQAFLDAQAAILQEVMRQPTFYVFVRTYGFDAVQQLAPEVRDSLLPKMPVAKEIAELIKADPAAPNHKN